MMHAEYDATGENEVNKSYYYAIDRMYNVRYLLDAAGAMVESYAYDPYGKPLIRECAGRGDMTGDSIVSKDGDEDAFLNAMSCTTFDPRADVDDDGDVDRDDAALYDAKIAIWDGTGPTDVKTARSLIGNPYMFQGRPHFVTWTYYVAEHATLMLNDHRNRFADPMTGRWLTKDPMGCKDGLNLFQFLRNNPLRWYDPTGTACQLPDGSCTDSFSPQGGTCESVQQPGSPAFQQECESVGGTYSKCPCVTNSQGCPLSAPGKKVGDSWCNEGKNSAHPGSDECYRGVNANSGAQCCYAGGCLIGDGSAGAGSADAVAPAEGDNPDGSCDWSYLIGVPGHFFADYVPYLWDEYGPPYIPFHGPW